jgi:hypothetical protein
MSGLPIGATGVITAINSTPTAAASSRSAVEIDCVGLSAVGIQIKGTYTAAGGLSGQATVDGLTWVTLGDSGTFTRKTTGVATATVTSAEQDVYTVSVRGFRTFRISALGAVTGSAAISIQGADMGAGEGGGGGGTVDTVVAGSGISVDATDPANPIVSASGGGSLDPVVLGAGPTAITHDDHSNRGVSSAQAAATSIVFAVTATSGAVDQDLVTIQNVFGSGIMTASGAIDNSPGCRLWVPGGETFIAEYNGANNKYYSKTRDYRKGEPFGPSWAYKLVNNSATPVAMGGTAPSLLDSSTNNAVLTLATDLFTHHPRIIVNSNATTAGKYCGHSWSQANGFIRFPTILIPTGFKLRFIGGINDAYSAGTFAMGITSDNVTAVEPSALANELLFGGDTTDTNMQIMHNGSKVDLGANFPNHTNGLDFYEVTFDCYSDGTGRFCHYVVKNYRNAAVARGTLTTSLPAEGARMGIFHLRSNMAQSGSTVSIVYGGTFMGEFA